MFITLEGPDGSGKTRQIEPLANFLRAQGHTVFTAREPGSTSIGDQVRTILMNLQNTRMHPRTETLLFCAARAQLVEEIILPHLDNQEVVLLDRYADSTMAYQGYGHQYDLDLIRRLLDFATGGLKPAGCAAVSPAAASGTGWTPTSWSTTIACARATWKWCVRSRSAGGWWTPANQRIWYNLHFRNYYYHIYQIYLDLR